MSTSIFKFMSSAQRTDVLAGTLRVDTRSAWVRAHSDLPEGSELYLPLGAYRVNRPGIEFTKRLSIIGESKFYSLIYGAGFAVDATILKYAGTSASRIQDITLRNFAVWSDNNQARGIELVWLNKSIIESVYLYNLYRGLTGDNAWSNSFRNVSAYNITTDQVLLQDECNNIHFDRVEFRGANGCKVTGNCAGLNFTACDFEGITDINGGGIVFQPGAGKKVIGVNVLGGYFENIKGNAIKLAGADTDSVRALTVKGSYLFGGHDAYFGRADCHAQHAIVLSNVSGFDISENHFLDWQSAAFSCNGSESKGAVKNNTGEDCPALTNTSNLMSASVEVQNNFAGRVVEWPLS